MDRLGERMGRMTLAARASFEEHLHTMRAHIKKGRERSKGEAVRPHDIYACYSCELNQETPCKYRRRAKFMSNLDQWIECPRCARVLIRSLK